MRPPRSGPTIALVTTRPPPHETEERTPTARTDIVDRADTPTPPHDSLASPSNAAVRALFDAASKGDAILRRGTVVGRYVILDSLGRGGMGVVYSVYDPELDRKVALKLLLPGRGSDAGRTRLVREAQALAKLAHPNVVAVHDAGVHDDQVWVAMEFVPGQTLSAWAKDRPRPWTEILHVLLEAARGVAAAHSVGLVHRDLKPENVMVDRDGRVRVMDFGLAHGRSIDASGIDLASTSLHDVDARPKLAALALRLTQAGAIQGTPAYMSPEQWEGKEVEAAADQFGWCVMAWELLYGERPFAGETVVALAAMVLTGRRKPPSVNHGVPAWLRRVLDRGLAVQPAHRWPSMAALIDTLIRARTRARLRIGLTAVLGVVLLIGGGWVWHEWGVSRQARLAAEARNRQIAQCESDGASIGQVWNDEARAAVRDAFVATGVHYAAESAEKVMPWLDKQTGEWQQARTDVCLAAHLHATLDADSLERALWCLDERRTELESTIAEFSQADAQIMQKAIPVASTFSSIARCTQTDALAHLPGPPTERREDAHRVLADLSGSKSLDRLGAYDRGRDTAKRALDRAETLSWPPLLAAAQLQYGRLLERSGKYAEAEPMLEKAFFVASKGGAPDIAFSASVELMYTVGYKLGRLTDGLRWSEHAAVILAAIGDVEQVRSGSRTNSLAIMYAKAGRFNESKELFRQVLTISETVFGKDHPDVAKALNNLARVHYFTSDYPTTLALHSRALAIRKGALGAEHIDVTGSLDGVGSAYQGLGDIDKAMPFLEEALKIRERLLGPEHPEVAGSLNNMATAYIDASDYAPALPLLERSLAIKTKIFGAEHDDVAWTKHNLAIVYSELGRAADAEPLFTEALRVRELVYGPEHLGVARTLLKFAHFRRSQGHTAEARQMYERGLAIEEKAEVVNSAFQEGYLRPLAAIAWEQGRPKDALRYAERALQVLEDSDAFVENRAYLQFIVAQALRSTGGDRTRAEDLARDSLTIFRASSEPDPDMIGSIERWLSATTRTSPRR